jgi:alkylation response protein AidB-like acyl-CoA dehydrogenase
MYSFVPDEDQKMLIEVINRYAANDLRPKARDADEALGFSAQVIHKGWELGVLQASIPEEYGGFGDRSAVTGVLAIEEMAYGDLAGTLAVMTPGLFALPILLVGSEEQKQKYLPEIVEADWQPYTAALIEPSFDFDPRELRLKAEETTDGYLLSGKKINVPFADQASAMLVYANLEGKTQGFIVEGRPAGMEVGEPHKLLGINALPNFPVTFNNVWVSRVQRLGGPDGHAFEPIFASMHVAMAAAAVGLSRAAFEYARDYAKEREAFGVKIAQKQAIAFMLAEMATEIEAIRLLTWEAAWMIDHQKEDANKEAYLALTGATDMAMMVTDRAVQILGGYGYIREYPVEMWMRNGRGFPMLNGLLLV